MLPHQATKRIERALRFSTLEGMAFGAVLGAGEHFTSVYAVALGATNSQVALLTSIPQFLGAVAQTGTAYLQGLLGSRKRVVLLSVGLNSFMWLPILSAAFLPQASAPLWLIAFLTLYVVFGSFSAPTWGSIMAEVVPSRLRGRYFARRTRWSTAANMLAFLLAGGLLFLLRDEGLLGFILVFGAAFAFRMLSLGLLTTLVELPHGPREDERLGVPAFLRQLPRSNLGRAILYIYSVTFVVNLAGPFFVPYMLRQLEMSYLTFTALEMATSVASLWAVTHWGTAADRAGNLRIWRITGVLIGLVPLLWLVSNHLAWLAFIQFYAGAVWAGFSLVSTNFIYDATTPQNRTAYLAYYSAGTGIASGLGALAGSLLIRVVPSLNGSIFLSMFLLSGTLRLLMAALFLPRIREVRQVREIGAAELFHVMVGGWPVHRPAHHGRVHHVLHGHREEEGDSPKGPNGS